MYNHEPERYVCPLCQIARGEETEKGNQEDSVLFRSEVVTIFVAGKWWRSNPGHIIVIPTRHIENLYDMPEELGHIIFDYSKKVAIILKHAYGCDGVSTRQHNEPAGNQDVFHFHLHVFPRYTGDNLYINYTDSYWPSAAERKPFVDKLLPYFKKMS